MANCQNLKFDDPETQLNFRKFLQVAGIENMLINDGRRISDTEVLNEIRKEMLSHSEGERPSLIPACISGDEITAKTLLASGECDVDEVAPDGETALTCAVSANAANIVECLLKHGAKPNFRGKKVECTPLMEAASVGYSDIVRLLLEYGACVSQTSNTNNTALHYAATSGHLECVCLLLQYNSPMEVQNETGHTPLMEATSNGHIDVAGCLIQHGCNINTHSTEFKESALTLASYKGHAEMVRFLLEAGADHEHRTDEMHTALMEAAMEGHVEVARLLLAHGANVNIPQDSFESPLTLAACGGHTELAHLLIGYGADIEEVNDEGYTPLMEAAREGHEETVALLLAVGADVNARTEETQETALTLAACGGFIEVCEMLLNAGADIEVGGIGCSTPLMEAAQEGHLELVRRLLQRGAAVNAVTATGDTALHYAAENGHDKVCRELLDWGALFRIVTEGGRTPLMKAARSGNLEVVKLFVERKAEVDQPTTQNDANALSLACSGGHAKVVKYLLQNGADPRYQLRDGSTMLIEAARSGNPAVLRLILDYPNWLDQPSADVPPTPPNAHVSNHVIQQQLQQHQLQFLHRQHHSYPLPNRPPSSVGDTPDLPPPSPPPLPLSLAGAELCTADPTHAHVMRTHACHAAAAALCHGQHPHHHPSPFQAPNTNATTLATVQSAPTTSSQQLDAALVSAYAVGWADGAASLVQQQSTLSLPALGLDEPQSQDAIILSNTSLTSCSNAVSGSMNTISVPQKFQIRQTIPLSPDDLVSAVNAMQLTSAGPVNPSMAIAASDVSNASACSLTAATSSASSLNSTGSSCGGSPAQVDHMATNLPTWSQEPITDKNELLRRFEAMLCPYTALRAARSELPQSAQLAPISGEFTTTTSISVTTTNAAAVALSRLADQHRLRQSYHESCPDGGSPQCPCVSQNIFAPEILDQLPFSSASISSARQQSVEQAEMDAILGCSASDTTPILSSCHSSSSVLSTPGCSHSSPQEVLDSVSFPENISATSLASYEYELDKIAERLQPSIDSPYLDSVLDPLNLSNTQTNLHDVVLDHNLLASYRHYHHPASHLACALDPNTAAAAVAGLGHPTSSPYANLHHRRHHHPMAAAIAADGNGLLHLPSPHPQAASAMSVDALMASAALTYDPSVSLPPHSLHANSTAGAAGIPPLTVPRMLPTGTTMPVLTDTTDLTADGHFGLPVPDSTVAPSGSVTKGIDVNACIESSMETALTLACHGGYTELVRLLLERGADREHRDKKSHTPLHTAVYANQRAVVAMLLDYGADIEAQVDRTKDTALSIACSQGLLEIVEELLNRGAKKEHRNISDYTPLSLAASGGHVDMIQLLLRHGAEINSRTGSKLGISPLMLASMNGHTNAVRLLLEHGSDINAHIETNRNTALTLACFQGRHAVVSLLVERKANIEHRAKTGLTPLMEAASGDYVEVGTILLDHGADVNAAPVPSSRDTALTIAADKGNAKFVNLLLQRGAIVEARNKKGATPLWLASNGGHIEVVQSLIQYNADVNSQDNRKVSCIMAAFRKGHVNVVSLLVQYVTQFPSDKDCIRHLKAAALEKDLARRCQQCREIIIAAKEKQEREARKNANCLLEQIEQEEEERANREAMQARKRERKRMRKKAKQEKERQCKVPLPSDQIDVVNGSDPVHDMVEDQECADESSSERHSSTLNEAIRHARQASFDSQQSAGSGGDISSSAEKPDKPSSVLGDVVTLLPKCFEQSETQPTISASVQNTVLPAPLESISPSAKTLSSQVPASSEKSSQSVNINNKEELVPTHMSEPSSISTTEAKREKHRNKKQIQRAAKRAAAEGVAENKPADIVSISADEEDPILTDVGIPSAYYPISADGDGEVNWNALIESHTANFNLYLPNGLATSTSNENNAWTVVVPPGGTRTQRNNVQGRSGTGESADWKTTSNSGSSKRRLSVPVSRHDIGKVIGQGGAVVSALRNMSGIQIDIESARSDEVTERMVHLKGASDAVQKTYETIQGLLNGSIAGNDVLLMYAALKKSTTTSQSVGKSILTVLNSKTSTANSQTTSTNGVKTSSSTRANTSGKTNRKTARQTASAAISGTISSTSLRSTSSLSTTSLIVNRTTTAVAKTTLIVSTCSNSNNNSTVLCGASTVATSANGATIMTTKIASASSTNWNSKLSSTRGNFASVAAAGLGRVGNNKVITSESVVVKSDMNSKFTCIPNLMSNFSSIPPVTAPVSLLSLNVSPLTTTSQLFPDLTLAFPSTNEPVPDSLDETSFPPLNPKAIRISSQFSMPDGKVPPASVATTMGSLTGLDKSMESLPLRANTETGDLSPTTLQPLTVSPPLGTATVLSQPSTPLGSGGSHIIATTGTPTATTQVKTFARAPGSERSAHQRNANITSTAPTISLVDSFPPSLMSLDVGTPSGVVSTDSLLLTPTKRVVSPESDDPEFHRPALPVRFRSDPKSDWKDSDVMPSTTCMSFQKAPGSVMEPHTSSEDQRSVLNTQLRSTVNSSWSLPASELNPNTATFEPSAFQIKASSAARSVSGVATQANAIDSAAATSLARSAFGELPASTNYSLDGTLATALRQSSAQNALKLTSNIMHPTLQQSVPSISEMSLGSNFIGSTTVTTAARSKPLVSVVPNAYSDSRVSQVNGLPGVINQPMAPVTQFHSMYSSTQQQSMMPAHMSQHPQQHRVVGNSPHPLLNQTNHLTMGCPPISSHSYTPPSGYIQAPGSIGPVNHAQLPPHAASSFAAQLLNGGNASMMGPDVGLHQSAPVQPVPIQPIGSERRRQAVSSLASNVPAPVPSGMYPPSSTNGSVQFGFPSSGLSNPSNPVHPQAPSPQQSSNPNWLMFMNLLQQQQQQHQQQNLGMGTVSSSPHPSVNWQSPPAWPSTTLASNFQAPGQAVGNIPTNKLSPSGMNDMNSYSSSTLLPSNLNANSGSAAIQQQMGAAMAAIGLCQWNSGGNAASNTSPMAPVGSLPPGSGGQTRWLYPPQANSAYPPNAPHGTAQSYYPDSMPHSLKNLSGVPSNPQMSHRSSHD